MTLFLSLSLKVQRETIRYVYSTPMDVSLKSFLVAYWRSSLVPGSREYCLSTRLTRAAGQRLKCVNKCHMTHFLSHHLGETDISYGNGNKLVVAWFLLCATCAWGRGTLRHYITTDAPTNPTLNSWSRQQLTRCYQN